jgi:hypothetical protein
MEKRIINENIKNAKNLTKIFNYIYPLSVVSSPHTVESELMLYYNT